MQKHHFDIPPIVTTTATAFGAETIVVLAIIFAIIFSSSAIADFLNRVLGN